MSQIPPQKFGAEYVAHLRELLDNAAEQIGPEHRTLASQAETASGVNSSGPRLPSTTAISRWTGERAARSRRILGT